MKLWREGDRVRWTTYQRLEDARPADVHHGAVLWCRPVPPGPGSLAELVALLRRLRRDGVRPLPRARAILRVGRGVVVAGTTRRGRVRVWVPWLKRLRPDDTERSAQQGALELEP